jgi:hypothetical protein
VPLFVLTLLSVLVLAQPSERSMQMRADVDRLVAAAEKLPRLWPWQPPILEIEPVVRHGKWVAPLLVALLSDDPDNVDEPQKEWRVQQQAALALCRIYDIDPCEHVFDNRAFPESNRAVKRFWVARIGDERSGGQVHIETECVPFASKGKVRAGTDFRIPLPRGLEFELLPMEQSGWSIRVGQSAGVIDYMWVVTPPYQTAPHVQIGAGYGLTARESAQIERHLRFVVTHEDYERARGLFTDWSEGRLETEVFQKHRAELRTGTLRLKITDFAIGAPVNTEDPENDVLDWIAFEGEACVPRDR